jgi:hypothetical protein
LEINHLIYPDELRTGKILEVPDSAIVSKAVGSEAQERDP